MQLETTRHNQKNGGSAGGVNRLALMFAAFSLAASLVVLGPRLAQLVAGLVAPGIGFDIANADFINYWMAGQLVLDGKTALLFDPPAYNSHLQAMFGADYPPHAWSYPPHAILIFLPLGLLPYKPALVGFLALSGFVHFWALRAFVRAHAPEADKHWLIAAHVAFVAINLAAAQNGFLTAALLVGAFAITDRNPLIAGFLLALLTFKPQLGILVPVALIFSGQWRTIGWAALFAALLVLVSIAAFGIDSWKAYVEIILPFQQGVMTGWSGGMLLMMPTVLSALRLEGVDAETASLAQTIFSIAMLPLALLALWRARTPIARFFALCLGTFAILPYGFNYDMGALVSAAAMVLATNNHENLARALPFCAIAMAPVLVIWVAIAGLPVVPLLLGAVLYMVARNPEFTGKPQMTA